MGSIDSFCGKSPMLKYGILKIDPKDKKNFAEPHR